MSALSKSKRINILQPDEIDNLFGIPIFNDDDREKWFDLNKQEQSLLKSKKP